MCFFNQVFNFSLNNRRLSPIKQIYFILRYIVSYYVMSQLSQTGSPNAADLSQSKHTDVKFTYKILKAALSCLPR